MKIIPNLLPPSAQIGASSVRSVQKTPRFQIIVEYAEGFYLPTATASAPEEAVESFLRQTPGCSEGDIALYDRDKRRVVASAKWKLHTTELGLRVHRRQNVFQDWHLALIGLEVQQRRAHQAIMESAA